VTTPALLDHFDLASLDDLPRIEELLQVGLLAGAAPPAEAESDEASEPADADDAEWAEPDDGPPPAGGSG
jgi:ribosomal protein L12E/L44/L45/RPP1/RPP2